jgi:hypothetical protein
MFKAGPWAFNCPTAFFIRPAPYHIQLAYSDIDRAWLHGRPQVETLPTSPTPPKAKPSGNANAHNQPSQHVNNQRDRPKASNDSKTNKPTHTAAAAATMAHLGPGKAASSKEQAGLRYPSNGKTIYHRPLNRTKTAELSQSSFAYLFSEMVSYAQRRVTGIQELEKRCVIPHPPLFPRPPPTQPTTHTRN